MKVACTPNESEPIIVGEHGGHTGENTHLSVKIYSDFLSGSSNVFVEGKPILRKGDIGTDKCECCGGGASVVKQGNESVLVNGKPIARKGDLVSHHVGEPTPLKLGVSSVNA